MLDPVRALLGLAAAEPHTTDAERACLCRHAAGRQRVVVIGARHGVAVARLRAAMDAGAELLVIDPFAGGQVRDAARRRIARHAVARVATAGVRWVRATGYETGQAYAATGKPLVDFVFIDGDTSYGGLSGDWTAWRPLVAPGGIVAVHDSRSTPQRPMDDAGSVRFTNAVILHDAGFTVVEAVDSLTVLARAP
jgi:predicted O-methyltransferase YrrM